MMPIDTYRLHQAERVKSAAEIRRADERAGLLAAAASRLAGRWGAMAERMEDSCGTCCSTASMRPPS